MRLYGKIMLKINSVKSDSVLLEVYYVYWPRERAGSFAGRLYRKGHYGFALSASCNIPEKLMSARSAISFRQLGIDRVFLVALLRILPRLKSRECGGQIIQHFRNSPLQILLLQYYLYFPLWCLPSHSSYLTVYPPEQGGRCWCCNHKSPRRGTCPFRG